MEGVSLIQVRGLFFKCEILGGANSRGAFIQGAYSRGDLSGRNTKARPHRHCFAIIYAQCKIYAFRYEGVC